MARCQKDTTCGIFLNIINNIFEKSIFQGYLLSLAQMYKVQFFHPFFPQRCVFQIFQYSVGQKTEKCYLIQSMYICQFLFFHIPLTIILGTLPAKNGKKQEKFSCSKTPHITHQTPFFFRQNIIFSKDFFLILKVKHVLAPRDDFAM